MAATPLGDRQKEAQVSNDGMNPYGVGFWVVEFTPADFAVSTGKFEVYHMALKGPLGSQVQLYLDRTFYDITNHGDVNSFDPNTPIPMEGGKSLYLYWNTAATPKPMVTVWIQQPGIL